jgi:peptidoglycan hydrolase-like protein with peptidoglycan-binding domain
LKAHRIKLEAKAPAGIPDPAVLGHTEPAIIAALGAYKQNEEDVKLVQAHLKSKGYYDDKVDGKFGKNTAEAFVKFLEENPDYRSSVGPDLLLKTEAYAIDNKISDELRSSLNLRDLNKLPTPDNDIRYKAYKDYFASQGRPEELARGIKVASELTGVPMEKLFAVMKQESAFGDYNPRYGNSSANRIANNYGQFTSQTYRYMNNAYGSIARQELGGEGIHVGKDWRSDPLVAPYMAAKYLKEMGGSYPAYVLPVMRHKGNSNAIVAEQYPAAARSNRHLFYDHGRPVSFAEAKVKILNTLADDYRTERKIVVTAQREAFKKDLLIRQSTDKMHDKMHPDKIYLDDRIDNPHKHGIDTDRTAGLVGDGSNPEKSAAKFNLAGSFKQAALADIPADLTPDPNGQGPKPSGWAPLTNDFC